MTITAEVYIHAARGTVWEKFIQITDWPRWDSSILAAHWLSGAAWQENAQFTLQQQGRWAANTTNIIRMVVPNDTTVWESVQNNAVVSSAHFADDLGGCKLQLRLTAHGLAVLTRLPWRGGQQRRLTERLHAFKVYVERK